MRGTPDRNGAGPDVDAAFADQAFAPLKAKDAAFAILAADTAHVLWANEAAAAHWGAADARGLAAALFGAGGRGGWLDGLTAGLVPGRPPRLSRSGLAQGFRMRARTALLRSWAEGDAVLIALASPDGAAAGPAGPDDWRRPAWDAGSEADGDGPPPEAADADAGAALASRSQVAVLRDRLNRAVDGAAAVRLLWRTDAADAVTQIDADTFARLASPMRFDRGTLSDAVAPHDPDAAARLRDALSSRATWSGIAVALPVADAVATVPMVLGASPIFGADRRFAGFRGFGTLDLGRLELARGRRPRPAASAGDAGDAGRRDEAGPPVAAPEPEEPEAAAAQPGETEADPRSAAPDARPEPMPPESTPEPEPAAPEAAPALETVAASAKVVDLRAFQASVLASVRGAAPLPVERDADEGAADDGPAGAGEGRHVPPSADVAFLMLGEALRARIGALGPAAEAPPDPGEDAAALGGPEAEMLGRLPVALAVTVGSRMVYANPAAAARLGATAAGDLPKGEAGIVPDPVDAGMLRGPGGAPIPARSAAIAWCGAAATVWVLDEAGGAPRAGRPATRSAADDVGAGELLDRVADAVALLDAGGNVRRLNRRGEDWFGAADPLGRSFSLLLSPDSRPAALALLDEVRAQRDGSVSAPLNRDVMARTGGAEPVPLLLTLGRLGLAGFYATLREAGPAKRAEPARAGADRREPRDSARLAGLLGKVSHEIRTPLNAILGFAEVMMDERFGPLGNPRYRDYLKDIHTSGTQVMALVEDMLDLSRIEAGQVDIAVAPVDVNRIVTDTVAAMQAEAHRERVIMRTSLGARIPPVLADERSARQIVRNLLSNAVKFNEPGGQVIVSTALNEDRTVVLRVRDTGVGMTDEEIAAALEPFGGVAASPPDKGAGNGLGLPLTRALVGANGASMTVRSRPGEGTLVEVAFAAAEAGEGRRVPA